MPTMHTPVAAQQIVDRMRNQTITNPLTISTTTGFERVSQDARALLAKHHAPESRSCRRVEVVERVGESIMVQCTGL